MRYFFLFLSLPVVTAALLAPLTRAGEPGKLTLKGRESLESTSPLRGAVYQKNSGTEMINGSQYSPDNGKTWQPMKSGPDFDSKLPYGYRRSQHSLWRDPVNGNILMLLNCMDTPGKNPHAHEPRWQWYWYYLRYRVSTDGGKTYLCDEPIVQKGEGYSPEHPLDGVYIGKNCYFLGDVGCDPIRTREGTVLVPMQWPPLNPDGNGFYNPGGGWYWLDSRILIGRWTDDNRLKWEISESIEGDGTRTTRGLYEPTLAQMPDGNILCVMRGSNGGPKDSACKLPSRKWKSVSKDGGKTWSKPEPWTYSDGEPFFSPASMSELIVHSNGRIYWIGNLSKDNCKANHPRWPLVIGEVDPETYGLIRETVLVVDTKKPEEDDVNLSHWHAYEDRPTGDIVLAMSRASKDYKSYQAMVYVVAVK